MDCGRYWGRTTQTKVIAILASMVVLGMTMAARAELLAWTAARVDSARASVTGPMYQAPDGSLTIETWADARDGREITLKAHMLCLEHYSYRTGKEFVGCVHDFRPSAAQVDDYRAGFRSMWGLDSRVSEDRHDGLCLRALPGLRVSVGEDCTRH